MSWLTWKFLAVPVLLGAALFAVEPMGEGNVDRRLEVPRGGRVDVDLVLGGGLAFDHGSLTIRSHDADDVRLLAETTGWGQYAVDLETEARDDRLAVVGRVDGPLDWMFGGPTVDVSLWVPSDLQVDAHIEGGPLVLEDLSGPIQASVDASDVTLRRAEGPVELSVGTGSAVVEDVEGDLVVRSRRGRVEVSGVQGGLTVEALHGSVEIESVTGPVTVAGAGGPLHGDVDIDSVTGPVSIETDRGSIDVNDVRGDVTLRTARGRIEGTDIRGQVVARTERGGIDLDDVDGRVRLESGRGSIDVHFDGPPEGELITDRGSISVRVPGGAAFDLDARTARGEVRVGDHDAAAWQGTGDDGEMDEPEGRGQVVVRQIHGGGPTLVLRSGRGSIRVDD